MHTLKSSISHAPLMSPITSLGSRLPFSLRSLPLLLAALLCTAALDTAGAQTAAPSVAATSANPGQVVVTGTVPDDASKLAILSKLREVYGANKVVDQLSIGSVVVPPNWNGYVQKLITPSLKLVNRGQLKVDGNVVSIRGEVANEAQKQQLASDIATNLNPSYTVNNGLRVTASEQGVLDQTLANRIVEFESSSADLTPIGKQVVDEMASAILKLKGRKVEVIGHTDSLGLRASNVALSQARAESVKAYLGVKGVDTSLVIASGAGPDRPVANNATPEGRAKNRRIEFRLSQ